MEYQTIEIEAISLEEARNKLSTRLRPDLIVLEEHVLCNGDPQVVEGIGETIQQAREDAKSKIPSGAIIEAEETKTAPKRVNLQIDGDDEASARKEIVLGREERIETISLIKPSRKGFLGFGKSPNVYDVSVRQRAIVEIRCRQQVKIRARLGLPAYKSISSLRKVLYDQGGPISRGFFYDGSRESLLEIHELSTVGNVAARQEILRIIKEATKTVLSIEEFARYHGYRRQQIAAEILGLVGDITCIGTLLNARYFQSKFATGGSEYSNNNTEYQVKSSIDLALSNLGGNKRQVNQKIINAAEGGDFEQIKVLLASGTEPNSMNEDWGFTALHGAASTGRHDIADLLLANGANVNALDLTGATPLHEAAKRGHLNVADLLLRHGADVNRRTFKDKMTPLQMTLELNPNNEMETLLRKHGGVK